MNVPPIILDIEASGFGRGSYPIEIGVAMDDCHLTSQLIKPFGHWVHWQKSAEKIHGIKRETLLEEGRSPYELALALNRMLAGRTVFSDGWGVDRSWLALLFHEVGLAQSFKLESIYTLLDEAQLDSWAENKRRVLELTGMKLHRAGTDAFIIQQTYLYTVDIDSFEQSLLRFNAA